MKHRIQGLLLGIVLILCIGAARQAPRFWQDVILKPNQAWTQAYDRNMPEAIALEAAIQDIFAAIAKNDSQFGYNVAMQQQAINAQGANLDDHEARLKALEAAADPNTTEDPNGTD